MVGKIELMLSPIPQNKFLFILSSPFVKAKYEITDFLLFYPPIISNPKYF